MGEFPSADGFADKCWLTTKTEATKAAPAVSNVAKAKMLCASKRTITSAEWIGFTVDVVEQYTMHGSYLKRRSTKTAEGLLPDRHRADLATDN